MLVKGATGAETGITRENRADTLAADALAPWVTRDPFH